MRALLDTHAFLWFVTGNSRLSRRAMAFMQDSSNELFISAASVWEMAIKSSLKRLILPLPLKEYMAEKIQSGFRIMAMEWEYIVMVENLPFHHRNPFDRLIIAQAIAENVPVITADPVFKAYGVKLIW